MNSENSIKKFIGYDQKVTVKAFLNLFKGKFHWMDFAPQSKLECELPAKILIGTHHKTGTVWLKSVFLSICRYYSLKFYEGKQDKLPKNFDVFLQDHSKFDLSKLKPFRGVHIIRDPRDVIISGCFYHQKSKEYWLHQPRKNFQGLTYQQKINSYESLDDKILFEMENIGRQNISDILSWSYECPSFYEIKYEDLINDADLMIFHQMFSFLGFPGSSIPTLLTAAYEKSLFSGQYRKSVHIRSGKTSQWKKHFKSVHKDRFVDLFGDALIKLGYEKNNDWANF